MAALLAAIQNRTCSFQLKHPIIT